VDQQQNQIYQNQPLIKLKILDSNSVGNLTFKLEEKLNFLKLNKTTGELWFLLDKFSGQKGNEFNNIVVTAETIHGNFTRMSINLKVRKFSTINDFCQENVCFYESVIFHTREDFSGNFKPHEVGEISPKLYTKLCKTFEVKYKLLNGKPNLVENLISPTNLLSVYNTYSVAICHHQK
jgi:hypothetical protein